jgi:hypothetical protein
MHGIHTLLKANVETTFQNNRDHLESNLKDMGTTKIFKVHASLKRIKKAKVDL